MRILQLITYFAPAWSYGGSLRAVYEITKRLIQEKHEITVYTTDVLDKKNRIKLQSQVIEGIKVKYFPTISNLLSWYFKGFISIPMIKAIRENINDYKIVHLHEMYTFQAIIAGHYLIKNHIPYIFSGHGSVPIIPERGQVLIKKIYMKLWGKRILNNAAVLIALTENEKKQYLGFGVDPGKVVIIPYGVDLKQYKNTKRLKGKFRKKYQISGNHKIILYVGRIYKLKGIDLLIKAFAGLLKNNPNLILAIVGPDAGNLNDYRDLCSKLGITEKVIFPGYLEGVNKIAAFVDSDIYCHPSYSEGLPMSVLEAGACGLPLVATIQSNLPEIIQYQAGYVVETDSASIKKALSDLLSDKERMKKFGKNSSEMVKRRFNWEVVVDEYVKIYEKINADH